jgi:hypothetical protein
MNESKRLFGPIHIINMLTDTSLMINLLINHQKIDIYTSGNTVGKNCIHQYTKPQMHTDYRAVYQGFFAIEYNENDPFVRLYYSYCPTRQIDIEFPPFTRWKNKKKLDSIHGVCFLDVSNKIPTENHPITVLTGDIAANGMGLLLHVHLSNKNLYHFEVKYDEIIKREEMNDYILHRKQVTDVNETIPSSSKIIKHSLDNAVECSFNIGDGTAIVEVGNKYVLYGLYNSYGGDLMPFVLREFTDLKRFRLFRDGYVEISENEIFIWDLFSNQDDENFHYLAAIIPIDNEKVIDEITWESDKKKISSYIQFIDEHGIKECVAYHFENSMYPTSHKHYNNYKIIYNGRVTCLYNGRKLKVTLLNGTSTINVVANNIISICCVNDYNVYALVSSQEDFYIKHGGYITIMNVGRAIPEDATSVTTVLDKVYYVSPTDMGLYVKKFDEEKSERIASVTEEIRFFYDDILWLVDSQNIHSGPSVSYVVNQKEIDGQELRVARYETDYVITPIEKNIAETNFNTFSQECDHYASIIDAMKMKKVKESRLTAGIMDSGVTISSGDGVTRDITEKILDAFVEKNIVTGRFWHFTPEVYSSTVKHRQALGKLLSITVPWNTFNSFPLIFLIVLKIDIMKKSVTERDLEYFASERDPAAFKQLISMRDNPSLLKACGCDSYQEALFSFCELDQDIIHYDTILPMVEAFSIYRIPPKTNLGSIMALLIDRKSQSISRDSINIDIIEADTNEQMIRQKIMDLDQDSFSNLLYNWSGSSVLSKQKYTLSFGRDDGIIFFSSCSRIIAAAKSFLDDIDNFFTIITTRDGSFNRL